MKWYESIAFKIFIFIIFGTASLIAVVSYSVYTAAKDEIAANVEHKLILEGEYVTSYFLKQSQNNPTRDQYETLLRKLAKSIGGYTFIEDKNGEIVLASDEAITKRWKRFYRDLKTLDKPHPYKHYIKFRRFVLDNDPFFGKKSYGIIYDLPTSQGYKLGMAVSYEKAFAPVKKLLSKILAAITTAIVLLSILGYLVLKKEIVTPLKKIAAQLHTDEEFSIDSLKPVFTEQKGEIGELVDVLNKRTSLVKELTKEIEDTQKEIVFTMGAIGESRSKETGNHVKRVAEYSRILALGIGMSEKEADLLKEASPMHDIGKVAIPDSILNKPGRLSPKEREIMDRHTTLGYEMLKHSKRELLQAAATVAYEHHEKWDGSGYPRGLKGEEIHIYGRITAVADVFDALGSDRVYKKAWADERIFELFKEERGKHFDPRLVDVFFENLDEILKVRKRFADV